jgi:signal recognition particle subunit SRP54
MDAIAQTHISCYEQVVDNKLMNELKTIKNILSPDEVLLVVDSMTGQEAANLTKEFNDAVGITGAILTKLDGDTRGGAALSVQSISGKPIKFVGVGEKVEALEAFYPDRMASRILGMGDVVSMVEKAKKVVDEKEAARVAEKMLSEKYDFDDFISQSKQIKSMGSLGGMLKMMPGAAGISGAKLAEAEERLKISESMISSMTKKERSDPSLLLTSSSKTSRLERIAKGSGRSLKQAKNFMEEFMAMRQMMQKMSKMAMMQQQGADPTQMDPAAAFGNRSARRAGGKTKKTKLAPSKGFGKK